MVAALSNHASTSWSASSPASKSWKCGAQNSHLSRRERVGGGGCRGGAGEGQRRERGGDATGRAGGVGKRGMFGVAGVGCASSRTSPPSRTSWRTRHRGMPRRAVAATTLCCVSIGRLARRPTRRDARAADTPERAPSRARATPRRATSACRRGRRARACAPPPRRGLARVFNFDVFKFEVPLAGFSEGNVGKTLAHGLSTV